MSQVFEDVPMEKALAFAAEYPLAWIVPVAEPEAALLMPVLFETGADGEPVSLLGHLPIRSPATQALGRDGRAVMLFLGPNAYIPPAWARQDKWAPTWNFLSLKVTGTVQVREDLTREAVERLARHMEARSDSGWSVEELGERYEELLRPIIGYRATIDTIRPRFKIAQDERPETKANITEALGTHPLTDWMA